MDFNKVKTYVCPVPAHPKQIEVIKKKIVSAGGTLVCHEKTDLSDYQACVDQCEIVVILICPETEAADYVAVIVYAGKTGKRVIGVWPEDQTAGAIPAAINREGDGVVTLEDLTKIMPEKETVWQLPDGKERPKQKTPRHKG